LNDRAHAVVTFGASGAGCVLTLLALAMPAWQESRDLRRESRELRHRCEQLRHEADEERRLGDRLEGMRLAAAASQRIIPQEPEVAAVMRRLSLPVDGVTVLDQTFSAGSDGPAVPGEEGSERVKPLTVDLIGSFESAMAIVHAAEAMDRLVRVASVRLEVTREQAERRERREEGAPELTASIGLEVVYAVEGSEP